MSNIKKGNWTAKVNVNDISIDKFSYNPGDAKRITSLLGFAGSMSSLDVLPPEIKDTPFVISFSEDGSLTLCADDRNKEVKFNFEEIDDLIVLINDMVKVSIDQHTLRPRPRGAAPVSAIPGDGDIIHGRG